MIYVRKKEEVYQGYSLEEGRYTLIVWYYGMCWWWKCEVMSEREREMKIEKERERESDFERHLPFSLTLID